MMKSLPFILTLLVISSVVAFTQVRYTVTVPLGTTACYLAGEMNNWTQQKMESVDSITFTLVVTPATLAQKYKYCSGPSWDYVERVPQGSAGNRSYTPHDTVSEWTKVWMPAMPKIMVAPAVSAGTLRQFMLPSNFVDPRPVYVWLPPGYDSTKRYPVIYMQDGQMLFDSTKTWNKQEWMVDETVSRLIAGGAIPPVIVVGIGNNGSKRNAEYFPQAARVYMPYQLDTAVARSLGFPVNGDRYLEYLVREVKPFVDSAFATYPDARHTFVAGSSRGGLISMYAVCEYPEVFGGAACLSTHWTIFYAYNDGVPAAIRRYMDLKLPSPQSHRFYFDYGTATLDTLYAPYQPRVDSLMAAHDYTAANWLTKMFPGDDHTEHAWARRLRIPLEFLLKP